MGLRAERRHHAMLPPAAGTEGTCAEKCRFSSTLDVMEGLRSTHPPFQCLLCLAGQCLLGSPHWPALGPRAAPLPPVETFHCFACATRPLGDEVGSATLGGGGTSPDSAKAWSGQLDSHLGLLAAKRGPSRVALSFAPLAGGCWPSFSLDQ